jgi:hypothetical protein
MTIPIRLILYISYIHSHYIPTYNIADATSLQHKLWTVFLIFAILIDEKCYLYS